MSKSSNPAPTHGAWLPAALLISAGLVATTAHLFVFPDPTAPDDWKRAANFVEAKLEPDEWIRVHPTWSEAPLPYLTAVGDRVDRKRELIPEDLVGVESFHVIAEKGHRDEVAAVVPGARTAAVEDFGTVEVIQLEFPAPDAPFVARQELDRARIERVKKGGTQACDTWNSRERRWDCGRRDQWLYVADELREVGDEPRRCIYAHPLGAEGTLRLTWPDVTLGKTFRLRSGLDLRAARSARGKDVSVRLVIGGEEKVNRRILHDDYAWHLDVVETVPGEKSDVVVEIDSVEKFERFVCLDAFVWNE